MGQTKCAGLARGASMVCLAWLAGTAPGEPLFSNGSASPGVPALGASGVTLSGVPAPGGAAWSELSALAGNAIANAAGGYSTHLAGPDGNFRFADDFTVGAPAGWALRQVSLFAYQPGATGAPFAQVNLRVWSGPPGEAGSTILFGDASTNRMTSCVSENVYRVFSSVVGPLPTAPDTTRQVWRTTAAITPALYLPPGTYWLDWQYVPVDVNQPAYSPAVTIAGSRGVANGNARQLRPAYGVFDSAWTGIVDEGKPGGAPDVTQDLPFLLDGGVGFPCNPDYNQDGNADQGDIADLINDIASGAQTYPGSDPDVNGDGNLDQADVSLLVDVIAGAPCP